MEQPQATDCVSSVVVYQGSPQGKKCRVVEKDEHIVQEFFTFTIHSWGLVGVA